MSFWSEASPVTKGILVVGPILIVIGLLFTFDVIGGGGTEAVPERGLSAPP